MIQNYNHNSSFNPTPLANSRNFIQPNNNLNHSRANQQQKLLSNSNSKH